MKVFMRSDEYGYEEFEGDNEKEAIAVIKRLLKGIRREDDDIRREVGIVINDD